MLPNELTSDQSAALTAAKRAQRKFERADAARQRALDERTQAIRAALEAGVSYGQLASELELPRGTVQAAELRGKRKR